MPLRVIPACTGRKRLRPEMLWLLFVHITRVQLTLPIMRKMQCELTATIYHIISHYFLDSSFPNIPIHIKPIYLFTLFEQFSLLIIQDVWNKRLTGANCLHFETDLGSVWKQYENIYTTFGQVWWIKDLRGARLYLNHPVVSGDVMTEL